MENWNLESQYSSKNSLNKSKKLIGDNAKMTGNYQSPAVICSPGYMTSASEQFLKRNDIVEGKFLISVNYSFSVIQI